MAFRLALTRVLPYWGLFAFVVPLTAVAVRRFQRLSSVIRPTLPHLILTAVGFALIGLGGRMLMPIIDARGMPVQQSARQLFQTYFVLDVLTYTAVAGTLYAFHYYREARNRELMASRLEASLAEATLEGLEARVDPAFLFSTLETIAKLARQGEQKAVVDTLSRLSELLRAALNDEATEELPLSAEIEALPPQWRPVVECAVEPSASLALVPRGILYLLVEDALMYGTADARRITIAATRRNDEMLVVEVTNPARGWLGGDDLELATLDRRLRDLYGRGYAVQTADGPGGSRLTVAIPWRVALDGEARQPQVALA
jgi:hypothetical protein